MQSLLEVNNLSSSRRALVICATATLLAANTQLSENQLGIFGLKVIVDMSEVVAIGRVICSLTLVIFILRAVDPTLRLIELFKERSIENSRKHQLQSVRDSWGLHDDLPTDDGPNGELGEVNDEHDLKKRNLTFKTSDLIKINKAITDFLSGVILPFIVGFTALIHPSALSELIDVVK